MKHILAAAVMAMMLLIPLPAAESRLEAYLSPNSVSFVDFPNARGIAGARSPIVSNNGIGAGMGWTQMEGAAIVGFGFDADLFAFRTDTDAGRFRMDASIYAKVGVAAGSRIQTSLMLCSGLKALLGDGKALIPALGVELQVLGAPSRNLAMGFRILADLTSVEGATQLTASETYSLSASLVLSWRLE